MNHFKNFKIASGGGGGSVGWRGAGLAVGVQLDEIKQINDSRRVGVSFGWRGGGGGLLWPRPSMVLGVFYSANFDGLRKKNDTRYNTIEPSTRPRFYFFHKVCRSDTTSPSAVYFGNFEISRNIRLLSLLTYTSSILSHDLGNTTKDLRYILNIPLLCSELYPEKNGEREKTQNEFRGCKLYCSCFRYR